MNSSRFSGRWISSTSPRSLSSSKRSNTRPPALMLEEASLIVKSYGISSTTSFCIVRWSPAAVQCGNSTTLNVALSLGIICSRTITSWMSACISGCFSTISIDTSVKVASLTRFSNTSEKQRIIFDILISKSLDGSGDTERNNAVQSITTFRFVRANRFQSVSIIHNDCNFIVYNTEAYVFTRFFRVGTHTSDNVDAYNHFEIAENTDGPISLSFIPGLTRI